MSGSPNRGCADLSLAGQVREGGSAYETTPEATSRPTQPAAVRILARMGDPEVIKNSPDYHASSAWNPLVRNTLSLHSRSMWEASPLGDLTVENLRPEAGLPQGCLLEQRQSDALRSLRDNQENSLTIGMSRWGIPMPRPRAAGTPLICGTRLCE